MQQIPEQIWDLIFWLGVIFGVNLCLKDLLKWAYKFWVEDQKGRGL
jgi:hypothetical protein